MYCRRDKGNVKMKLNHYYKIISYFIITVVILSFFSITTNGADNNTKETNKLPMLWDFGAKKCIPCKRMAPILDQMAEEYKNHFIVKFTDVWIPKNVQEAKEYKITSIPTQIFFDKNGKELWRHVGFISKDDILEKWNSLGYNFIMPKAKCVSVDNKKIEDKNLKNHPKIKTPKVESN